jgi:isoquinoline 1-oxidoreductase beta subunit
VRIENPEAVAHTRIGWLRAVNNIQHAFAAQSFIAEVANALGKDHRDYLLELLGPDRLIDPRKISEPWNHGESPERYPINTGRLRRVIERVTKEANWRKLPSGQGMGLAAHYSFVSYMAAVVEVAVGAKGEVVIPRVDIAVDCGSQINPDRVRSQLEGACVMGLSQAVVSEITFKNGRSEQDNFHQYEIVRMNLAPKRIVVHFIPSDSFDAPLGGVGEPAVPVIAPALMNAIHGATGKRIRRLPLRDQLSAPV